MLGKCYHGFLQVCGECHAPFTLNTSCVDFEKRGLIDFDFWCFNATLSNISAISWRPVLEVEEAGVPGENHQPWASNW
jgi:hypothetical protein